MNKNYHQYYWYFHVIPEGFSTLPYQHPLPPLPTVSNRKPPFTSFLSYQFLLARVYWLVPAKAWTPNVREKQELQSYIIVQRRKANANTGSYSCPNMPSIIVHSSSYQLLIIYERAIRWIGGFKSGCNHLKFACKSLAWLPFSQQSFLFQYPILEQMFRQSPSSRYYDG